jgi:hypothetical protein
MGHRSNEIAKDRKLGGNFLRHWQMTATAPKRSEDLYRIQLKNGMIR